MKPSADELTEAYYGAMRNYVLAAGETELELAYEIGRGAMAHGFGTVELASAHQLALQRLLSERRPDADPEQLVARCAEFLTESLSPFEMTLRGYRDAIGGLERQVEERKHVEEQLRVAHEQLERRVQERTAELSSANLALRKQIDERERAERDLRESEERLRALVATVVDYAIFMLDPNGLVMSWNVGAERLKGYGADEVIGKHVSLFYTEADRLAGRPEQALAVAAEAGSFEEQGWRVCKDGSLFWADVVITALRSEDGSLRGFTKVTRDITERRRAEEALQRANEELSQANDAKDQFVAVLSHELRNPLAPIRNSLFILERAVPGSEQARRALTVVGRQVGQLTRLIDDLLDLTRISRNKIRLEFAPVELNELVQKAVEDHRLLFEKNGIELDFGHAPVSTTVNADSARLTQVVGNLLQNAAKFTGRGGRTSVTVSVDEARQHAAVAVTDTGAGIPREVLVRLFQPFMQADTTLDRSRGGLGLAGPSH
jgi:PAS domain S-box-containing protein